MHTNYISNRIHFDCPNGHGTCSLTDLENDGLADCLQGQLGVQLFVAPGYESICLGDRTTRTRVMSHKQRVKYGAIKTGLDLMAYDLATIDYNQTHPQ